MAARGSSYQRILEKYFPGAREGRDREIGRKGEGETGRWGDRKNGRETYRADVLTTQSSLLLIAHSRHLPVSPSPRLSVSPPPRLISLSSEHFRVTYPTDVDRRDANLVLNTLESARSDFLHRASAASLSTDVPLLEIRINASTGDFTARTGQPWWAAAATRGHKIELQPVGILKRRGSLTTTLRHELAHVVIDAVSHNHAPRWLGEGFAIYLAGEGPLFARYATKTKLSTDEIEKRLERPGSQQEMRMLYSLAHNQVLELIRAGSEASVWKKLAAG